jgi:hypothetical protein
MTNVQSTEPVTTPDPGRSPNSARTADEKSPIASLQPLPWQHAHTLEARSRHAVVVTLSIVVTALVLVMMAIPVGRRSRADVESQRLTTELQLTLTELRATIADYAASHGHFPGAGPSRQSDPFWIEHQLDLAFRRAAAGASNSAGTTIGTATFGAGAFGGGASAGGTIEDGSPGTDHQRRRAFHIDDPVLENPLNQRSNVRFLSRTEPWPLEGDDSSGWLYQPATGEIRANSPGTSHWTGTRFLDM